MTTYKLEYFHKSTKAFTSFNEAMEEAEHAIHFGNKNIVQINVIEKRGRIENKLSTKLKGGVEEIRDLKL